MSTLSSKGRWVRWVRWVLALALAPSTEVNASFVHRETIVVFFGVDPPLSYSSFRMRELGMGKGFNGAKGKQAELARKMTLAKKQQGKPAEEEPTVLSKDEIQLKKDRDRFAQLMMSYKMPNENKERIPPPRTLTRTSAPFSATPNSNSPNKVKANIMKKRKKLSSKESIDNENGKCWHNLVYSTC